MNRLLYLLLFAIFCITACRKVEKNYDFLQSVYSVITSAVLYKEDGSFLIYGYNGTDKAFVPGDTLTIAGILGGPNGKRVVKIGDSIVPVFGQQHLRLRNTSTKDTLWTNIDYMKVKITKGLQTGNNVPVIINVNGIDISAPGIRIQQFSDIPGATDTTLIVDKVGEWFPADIDSYAGAPLWIDGTVTNAGNVWFYNQQGGIFKMSRSVTQKFLPKGARITPVNGSPFTIQGIVGFTIDLDETLIYFSASTTEDSPDNKLYYITRLCKMDPISGAIAVLNRSTYMKTAAQYPRDKDLKTPLYNPSVNYLPAEGNLSTVKLTLGKMAILPDGSLIGTNLSYLTRITPKSPLADDPRFPMFKKPEYYAARDSLLAMYWYQDGNISSGTNNFVRIRNGVLKSLARPNPDIPVPGPAIFYYTGQQFSADGKSLYEMNTTQGQLNVISIEDFESDTRGKPGYDFSFSSVDSSSATGRHEPNITLQQANFLNFYVLSNGNAIFFPGGYGYPGRSMLGINFTKKNAYTYAGTEIGLTSGDVPNQNKTTGPAKWVNFDPIRRGLAGKNTFIGTDRRNNLYFISTSENINTGMPLPLEIYTIRKP
ncbi:hypothetical protein KTO58_05785 [Chitinophaga pendula]|uniref:hypothetical protein n=1 Tax=Chitinophaga TaxID=79328 RepID=UPI000BAEF719|nr:MULTISPECIES: hypothetical protein [Chitinophaga]ASZ13686.1 hypothetical protein CK934_23380 [Chitinophaga sp. MD30]UCJ08697.1 hypothetical protein KTO58_05785 [Chitinophaga pendula]